MSTQRAVEDLALFLLQTLASLRVPKSGDMFNSVIDAMERWSDEATVQAMQLAGA